MFPMFSGRFKGAMDGVSGVPKALWSGSGEDLAMFQEGVQGLFGKSHGGSKGSYVRIISSQGGVSGSFKRGSMGFQDIPRGLRGFQELSGGF